MWQISLVVRILRLQWMFEFGRKLAKIKLV